jgi:hypothetical protein
MKNDGTRRTGEWEKWMKIFADHYEVHFTDYGLLLGNKRKYWLDKSKGTWSGW